MPRSSRWLNLGTLVVAALATGTAACDWVSLAANALTYDTIARGEAGNVAAGTSAIYVTLAEDGLAVHESGALARVSRVAPEAPSASVDDIAIAGDLLFALDAREPGYLSVYSLRDPLSPRLVAAPRAVPVGPFSGVSAAAGVCVVSGGTSELTAWRYDSTGVLAGPAGTADLGRGQPDVLLAADGRRIFVATHYGGPRFGIDVLALERGALRGETRQRLGLPGAGFTTGGSHPANFPIQTAEVGADTLLVAHARGVGILGVGADGSLRLLGVLDVGGPPVSIAALGSRAVVAVAGRQPAVVELGPAPGGWGVLRRLPLPSGTFPAGIALTPARIVLAARRHGVLSFELAPPNP